MSDESTPTPSDERGGDVPDGVDAPAVTAWLAERANVDGALGFEVVQGGRSNLTYTVTDESGRRWVLRRPPLHSVLSSAHDVAREHRIMAALQGSAVPVPTLVGLEEDDAVIGAPFYVMDFVPGHVIRDAAAGRELIDESARSAAADSLVDTLAALHALDPDDVGLGDLAKKEDYIARQLHRWHGQSRKVRTRDLPLVDEVHDRLAGDIPPQGPAAIVHGDYRLDNLIVGDDGQVRAVLDWELCTLGDRRADLGLLSVYWTDPGDEAIPLLEAATVVEGFPDRAAVLSRYAEVSGTDLGELPYFRAFGLWKLAVIVEGVHSRFADGAYGEVDDSHKAFADVVVRLTERAAEACDEAGR